MEFRWQEGEEEAEYTVYAKAWGDENLEVFRRGVQIMVGGFFLWDHRIPGKKWQGISGRKRTSYTVIRSGYYNHWLLVIRRLALILQTMKKQMVSKERRDMLGSVVAE